MWTVEVVERDSTSVRTLVGANVESLTEELNGVEDYQWSFPKYDPPSVSGQGADVTPLAREVLIRLDGAVFARGVVTNGRAGSGDGAVHVDSPGVGWYLSRRFIDRERTNLLANSGFEADLTGWTQDDTTATVVTSPYRLGAKAVQLVQATTGADAFLRQTITYTAGGVGDLLTLAAHYYIDAWTGPALDARGLYVEGSQIGVSRALSFSSFDDADAQAVDQWGRVETEIWVPPGETWQLDVRLYSPNATVVWDAVQLVAMESTGAFDADIASLCEIAVDFVQNVAAGKDALHILTSCPPVGVTVPIKFWQHAEHTPCDRAIDEFVEREDGIDWWVAVTDTTKTFTTAAERGTDRSATVTLSLGTNVSSYSYDANGGAVETVVTVMGDGDGPDREEAWATNTAGIGLVLQGVYATQPGTEIDSLAPTAGERLSRGRKVRIVEVTTYEGAGDLITLLGVGDRVTVDIDDGWVQVTGVFRIVRRSIDARSMTMTLTMNEV